MNRLQIEEIQSYFRPGTVNLLLVDTLADCRMHRQWKNIFEIEPTWFKDRPEYQKHLSSQWPASTIRQMAIDDILDTARLNNSIEFISDFITSKNARQLGHDQDFMSELSPLSLCCHTIFVVQFPKLWCLKNRWGRVNMKVILGDDIVYAWNKFLKYLDKSKK